MKCRSNALPSHRQTKSYVAVEADIPCRPALFVRGLCAFSDPSHCAATFFPRLSRVPSDELLVLTNSHVLGRRSVDGLAPTNARVVFNELPQQGPFEIEEITWESPKGELDATCTYLAREKSRGPKGMASESRRLPEEHLPGRRGAGEPASQWRDEPLARVGACFRNRQSFGLSSFR